MTGLILPGMIDEPTWTAGSRTSPIPPTGPEESSRRSAAILPVTIADADDLCRHVDVGVEVGERVGEIAGDRHREPALSASSGSARSR